MNERRTSRVLARQRGAGMIETLVGIMIGLLVVLVVYNMLAVAEGYKRMTTGTADAQITGLISQFIAGQDAANGGNGLTSAYSDLINCSADQGGVPYTWDNSLKPISVLIEAGALPTDSDKFVSRQGASPHVVWPVDFRPNGLVQIIPPGGDIVVQSPNGFSTPAGASIPTAAKPFWAIVMANDPTGPNEGRCGLIQITNSTAPDAFGQVTLTQGAPATTIPYPGVPASKTGTGAKLLNLGRSDSAGAVRVLYEIKRTGTLGVDVNGQLLTTDCMAMTGCAGVAANPIAQNVVWMKVQYGIDTSPVNVTTQVLDGSVNCWTPADASTCGDWSRDTIITAPVPLPPAVPTSPDAMPAAGAVAANTFNRIVAVRIGFVVRSDEPDFKDPALYLPPAQTVDGQNGTRPAQTWLFNCAANTNAACPGRVLIPAPQILLNGWRYRIYETVIPLRNSIFNATIAP